MRRVVLILATVALMLTFALSAFAQDGGIKFKEITAQQLKKALDEGQKLLVVDARTEEEFALGHIPGAVNVNPNKYMFIAGFLPQDRNYPLVFYCRGSG
jgi:rhodanese-related sulfurtransferase